VTAVDRPSITGRIPVWSLILTVLGVIAMIVSLYAWVMLEKRKLEAQAALLRAAGGLPMPGGIPPGPGPSQPPMAGPSTHPGT